MQKQTFYQIDSKGKTREWNIQVDKNNDGSAAIVINAGLLGGKMINTVTQITEGKNIGRSNETTPYEQAIADANTEINKKVKKGYVTDLSNVKSNTESNTIKKPMKGDKYHPTGNNKALTIDDLKIRNKLVGIQRKLDGWRFRIHLTRTNADFYTSSGDLTLGFPQIAQSLIASFNKIYDYVNGKYGIEEYYLDGEIYNHILGFQATASACASTKNITPEKQALRDAMHFHIFDVCLDAPYTTREKVLPYFYSDVVKPVETIKINANEDEIEKLFNQFLSEGYEGLMIRQLDRPYEYKRSNQLTKYKPMVDDEFQIVGFKKSIAGDTLGSFELAMPDGRTFFANPKDALGSDKVKKEIWDNQSDYLGKWVTVEFLEYTKPDAGYAIGLPRHPRAKCFRKGKSQD